MSFNCFFTHYAKVKKKKAILLLWLLQPTKGFWLRVYDLGICFQDTSAIGRINQLGYEVSLL